MPNLTEDLHVGKRIRAIRQQLGLTQEELGELADLHYSYVGQVERGDKLPSLKSLRKLARALNTTVESLLEERENYLASPSAEVFRQQLINLLERRPAKDVLLVLEMARLVLSRLDEELQKQEDR